MKAGVVLKYNGIEAQEIISDDLDSFSFADKASGEADTIELNLSNRTGKWFHGYFPYSSDYIQVWITTEDWENRNKIAKLYCGKFAVDATNFTGFPERLSLNGMSVPCTNSFRVTQRNRTWKKSYTKAILRDMAESGNLELVYEAKDYPIEEISQSGKTNLQFAFSLCQEYGISLKIYNGKMIAYDQTEYEKKSAKYTLNRNINSYGVKMEVTNLYDHVRIQYTKDKSTMTYEFVPNGSKKKRLMYLTEKADSYADAETKAKAALRENMRNEVRISLSVMGDIKYKAAECFNLNGYGKLDGKYFVDSVRHTQSARGIYTCNIEAHRVVTGF